MDDFSEKQADNQKSEEESTVFSAPQSHNDNGLKSSKKSRIIAALSALLAVLILVGGTLAVIKLIPKKEEEKTPEAKKIAVLNFDKNKFDTVTVENKNGQFVLFPKAGQNAESTESADSKWYVKDLAEEKISVSKTDDIVSAAASIEAIIEITKKTFDDCGFEEPVLKVSVASQELGDYFLLFGAVSPDNSGIYLYSSVDEKIYLVQMSVYESFEFSVLDLANIESVSPLSENSEVAGFFENGNLTSFDELSVSSSGFSEKIIIKLLSEEEASKFGFSYKVISPNERFADTSAVDSLLSAFTSEITVSGVYSFNTDSADMSTFGLDDPDFAVSLLLGGHKFTYKFALQSDGFYALFGDGMNTIKKVSASSARYLSLEAIDFYNKAVYIRPLSEIKNMKFAFGEEEYSFDISENEDDEDNKFNISYGDKHIKSDNFQNFYMHFVSLSLVDFSSGNTGSAEMTVSITDNSGAVEKLEFFRSSATEYYCTLGGENIGKVTASSYNKLVSDVKAVAKNKDVESK